MYNVLIADDEVAVCKGLGQLIDWNKHGFNITAFAHNGRQAIELYEKACFDLVITDIRMPVFDGLTVMKKLREMQALCEIVILSAYRDFDYASAAIESGACAYLLKPINEELLVKTLAKVHGALDALEQLHPRETRTIGSVTIEEQASPPHSTSLQGDIPAGGTGRSNSTGVIEKVIEHMHANYFADITIAGIAREVGINPVYLGRLFKHNTGIAFNDYLNHIRVEAAAVMLNDPQNFLVYEICEKVGYKDINYFYRMFKNIMTVTPTEYKKQHFK